VGGAYRGLSIPDFHFEVFLRSFPQFLRFLAQSDTPTFRVLGLARQPYFQKPRYALSLPSPPIMHDNSHEWP
jgi:hypothetical protein